MPSIAIIIPAHNEEERIGNTLSNYLSYFNKLPKSKKLSIKIIVVLNACTDKTKEIVLKHKGKSLEFIEFARGGKGFAVIEGFKHALKNNYDFIGFVDADMSTTPEEFHRLFSNINNCDGVIASRYLKGAHLTPSNTIPRIIASRIYNFFIRSILLIPFRDTQCGAKIFKRKALESVAKDVGMTSWAFDIEMLYLLNKRGFNIKEIPTVWSNMDYSTINFWKSGPWMGLAVIRLRIINSPLKMMVRVYDRFIKIFRPAK